MDERQHTPVCAKHPKGCGPYPWGISWAENHVSDGMRWNSEAVMFASDAFNAGLAQGLADPQATITALREALKALTIDANRLCDRNTGGSYEDDCRRSLEQARAALALVPPAAGKVE